MGLSFFFSGMEAGVLALSPLRVRQLRRAGDARARALNSYMEKPEDFLWTILVGNTVANLVAVGLVAAWLYNWMGRSPWLRFAAFVGAVFCFYILCELLPKIVFAAFPNRLCLMLVGVFRYIHFVLKPLVALVTGVSRLMLTLTGGRRFTGKVFGSRDELRFMMQESGQTFTQEERAMINRVLDLQSLTVRQVAVPLAKVVSVRSETPIKEAMSLCRRSNFSRLPVWERDGKRDRIIGIVSLSSLVYLSDLDDKKRARDYLQPALILNDELRLEEALRRMQKTGRRLAVAVGPDKVEAGIISLEDILKAIFGEVRL
jgi:CBS domain containing-hemolysin-like protein